MNECKLSIIIVNYNVEYFLDQCLHSVEKAIKNINAEVFVVDNNSVDGSVRMVETKYPFVNLIVNKQNVGFAKANNQAIKLSKGEYILLLNPDTVVQSDTFEKVLRFMDEHPDAGGLGVQMIDGKGKFLPESKRGLPTPWVAFYKIFGLSKLFPKNRIFGQYHLTYLDKNQTHSVDVLSGAFMLLRKSVLDQVGLLDEDFFMYGEDIDLSYRIKKAGYNNYYYADTKIIHYKGESTKKGSLNYVITFYKAMKIFAQKHFSKGNLRFFLFLIQTAIVFRATLSILKRFFQKIYLPLLDFTISLIGYYYIADYWEQLYAIRGSGDYPDWLVQIALPAYIIIWQLSFYFYGGYDKKVTIFNLLKSLSIGTIIILIIYSLLDVKYRFSRALIFIGFIWVFIVFVITHLIFKKLIWSIKDFAKRRYIIVGDEAECRRVKSVLINSLMFEPAFVGYVSIDENTKHHNFLGNINQIEEIIRLYNIDEVIFCSKNIGFSPIIEKMSILEKLQVDIKIAPDDSVFIIGSSSINEKGDVLIIHPNTINTPQNKRLKRLLDFTLCFVFLILSPFLLFFVKKPLQFLANIFYVLIGKYSWVGYSSNIDTTANLPKIKKGVLNPIYLLNHSKEINTDKINNLNLLYARNYKITSDLLIISKGLRNLGNKPV